jgi:hypothetical protein
MKEPKIYIDEHKVSKAQIENYSKRFNRRLPVDYVRFLINFNGGSIYEPSTAYVWRFPIQRFFSLGDLVLQEQTNVGYNDWEWMSKDEHLKLDYGYKDLLPIAQCEQGTIMLSLNNDEFGNIYHSHYTGGEGVEKGRFKSFGELLKNYEIPENETPKSEEEHYYAGRKLFEEQFFWTRENLNLGFERFKEVYNFYDNPNYKEPEPFNTSIIQNYLHHKLIFKFLIEEGAEAKGLFNQTMNFEMIEFLSTEMGLDINEPYNGYHPIITWSSCGHNSNSHIKSHKELMDKILSSNLPIDYSIKDKEGRTIKERYEVLKNKYKIYWEKK